MYIDAPDYRGERDIERNPASKNATLIERYNAMLQVIHGKSVGDENASLSEHELELKRLILKKQTREVFQLIQEENPNVYQWSQLGEVDKFYYAMVLEEKAADKCQLDIFRCKDQWCARCMLAEIFKGKNQDVHRKANRNRSRETKRQKTAEVHFTDH